MTANHAGRILPAADCPPQHPYLCDVHLHGQLTQLCVWSAVQLQMSSGDTHLHSAPLPAFGPSQTCGEHLQVLAGLIPQTYIDKGTASTVTSSW